MTPGHLDDAMLIRLLDVFKSRKSPFTNIYKLNTKLFAFLRDVHAKNAVFTLPKGGVSSGVSHQPALYVQCIQSQCLMI